MYLQRKSREGLNFGQLKVLKGSYYAYLQVFIFNQVLYGNIFA